MSTSSFWHSFIYNTANIDEFNKLYREFHQYVALPDHVGLKKICENNLADYVSESVKRIHFHGLAIEMCNLRVK